MTYQETLDRLSDDTEAKTQKVLDQLEAGDIDQEAAIALLTAIILVSQKRGAAVAELSFAAQVSAMSQSATVTAGIKAGRQKDLVFKIIERTVSTSKGIDETRTRLVRIARNEPQEIAKQTYGKALEASKKVEGWTRGLDADPCELCVWWSRDGRVWPKDYPLAHHKGCQCTQVPVLADKVAAVPYSRILSR